MKRYKRQLVEDESDDNWILTIDNNNEKRFVYDLNHSIQRFKERFPELSVNKRYMSLLKRGVKKILKTDKQGYYLIKSRKFGYGIQLEWRPDRNNKKDKRNHGFTATTLDVNEMKKLYRNEKIVLVEKHRFLYRRLTLPKELLEEVGYFRYWQDDKVNDTFTVIEVD